MEFINVFYFSLISPIGGIESWYYYISKLYNDYDITLLYKSGNERQLNRLRKNIRCVKWDGKTRIRCKRLFVNFDTPILPFADAEEVIFVCHGDYKKMVEYGHTDASNLKVIAHNPQINRCLACSKTAQEAFFEITGVMPELCYNPVALDEPKRVIRLCSAQRMTNEKGKKRIVQLVKELDRYCARHDTEYEYDMFTNDPRPIENDRVRARTPRVDVNRYFGSYDYFIALSDAEGYCYSVVESLCRGTPVVVTPVPVFTELGCNAKNSITLEYDCSNVASVVQQMFEKHLKFKYTPKESTLGDYLIKSENTYKATAMTVRCIATYRDIQLDRTVKEGEKFTLDKERAQYLIDLGLMVREE